MPTLLPPGDRRGGAVADEGESGDVASAAAVGLAAAAVDGESTMNGEQGAGGDAVSVSAAGERATVGVAAAAAAAAGESIMGGEQGAGGDAASVFAAGDDKQAYSAPASAGVMAQTTNARQFIAERARRQAPDVRCARQER